MHKTVKQLKIQLKTGKKFSYPSAAKQYRDKGSGSVDKENTYKDEGNSLYFHYHPPKKKDK